MRVQHLQPIFPVLLPFQLDAFNLFIPNNFIHPSLLVSALSLSPELSLVDFKFNNFLRSYIFQLTFSTQRRLNMYALVMKHKKVEKEKKTTKVKKPKQVRAGASSSVDGGSTETESARAQKRKRKKVEHGDGKKGKTSTPATAAAATDGTSTYDLAQFTLSPEPVPVQAWLSKAGKKKEKKKAARAAFLASRSSKATAAAAQAMEEDQDDTDEPYFIKAESKTFEGSRPGYVFKLGAKGHGYYRELQAAAAEDEEDEEAEEDEAEQEDAEKDLEKVEGGEGNNKETANGEGRPVKKQHRVNGQRGVSWVDLVIGNGPQKPIKGRFALIRYDDFFIYFFPLPLL